MPHHPSDEVTESNVFDKVAKGNKDSGASDHPIHTQPHPGDKGTDKPSIVESIHSHSGKGPVITDDLPKAATKDELRKRTEELNK